MVKDNRGLSLVELVAVMAIMVIMSTAIIGFLMAGMRQYQEANSEVSRQSETQMVSNQLQDLLIDTANGVNYNDTAKELWAYNTETQAGTAVYTATKINWDAAKEELLFSKYIFSPEMDGSYTRTEQSADQLLAEHVTDFSADISQMAAKNIITFSLEITVRGKAYTTENVINLRNKIGEVADEEEAFEETMVEQVPVVSNVVINPSNACVWQGGSYSGFHAVVNGINYPAQDVVWSFSPATLASLTDANTMIDAGSGTVMIGSTETCQTLTVVATSLESKKDSAPESDWVSATATVSNKFVSGIRMGNLVNTADMSVQADVSVLGANFEGNEDLSSFITFEITDKETGKRVTDITTTIKAASGQAAGEKLDYIFQASAPEDKYLGRTISVCPVITYNGQVFQGEKRFITFQERKILDLTLQMQDENGDWVDCGGTSYTGNRGEKLSFRMKASYGTEDTIEYEGYWMPGDSDWQNIAWCIKRSGKVTSDYGDAGEIANSGTFTLGDLSRFGVSNQYSFSIYAEYENRDGSVVSQSINISIPEVGLSILERHDNQSKEFMTVGESQTIHFVVAGIDPSLYDLSLESIDDSLMQQGNVRCSGSLAILTPQKPGNGEMKFVLVDKQGNAIQKGSKDISISLPLEIGSKNLYVRTGAFGSYGYTLAEGSMYVPEKNYSSKGTIMYSLNGAKLEYKTSVSLLGTVKTVRINDGDISYTGTTYNGEYIWYR